MEKKVLLGAANDCPVSCQVLCFGVGMNDILGKSEEHWDKVLHSFNTQIWAKVDANHHKSGDK